MIDFNYILSIDPSRMATNAALEFVANFLFFFLARNLKDAQLIQRSSQYTWHTHGASAKFFARLTLNFKAAKKEIQKPSTWRATLFRCKFSSMFPVFHLAWSTCRATKTFVAAWRKLLRKVERGSTLGDKFWLCYSFFIKLTTGRATTLLVL